MNENKRSVSLRRLTRQRISPGWLVSSLALVLMLLAGCVPIQPAAVSNENITLRFAVSDGEGRPTDPYVHEFVDQVHTLSQGKITIELVWEAGNGTFYGFERGVLQRLLTGQFELGLVASRTWDTESIKNFQALASPFLITNDALAEAVATSDIATRMLDSLAPLGLVGLTLWPEDLRHPFSVVPDKPLVAPADFAGLNMRAAPSDITYPLIDALGAIPMFGDDNYQAAESGLRQGYSLTGKPIATGNVTFYPKYQVLFANGDAFDRLSTEQRTILHQAAVAAQSKAIAEHPKEVDAAITWCADGGTIVLASDEQVAAFEQSAQPIFDQLQQDPLNAEYIAAIRNLKASTAPSPGAAACAPVATEPNPASSADAQVWSEGLPPNGVWAATLTTDDFVRMGLLRSVAQSDYAGVFTITLKDGKYLMVWQGEQGQAGKCRANYQMVGDVVRLTYTSDPSECTNPAQDIQWRLDDNGLHLHLVAQSGHFVEGKAFFEAKPWQKVEAWSPGLPPNGVWQATMTTEELVQMGDLRSTAEEWAGVRTLTFQDGKFVNVFDNGRGFTGTCQANYAVVEDFVRFTFFSDIDECPGEVDDIQWRIDEEGLHLHLVAIRNSQLVENRAMYEAKPWQKVK